MNFYDALSKRLGLRKLSIREKILCTIFLFLLIQLILTKVLIAPKEAQYEELYANIIESESESSSNIYTGLDDFKEENLNLFAEKNNLDKENIKLTKNIRETVLTLNGKSQAEEIGTVNNFTDYYGFKTIELNRVDGTNFSYNMLAIKPTDKILHKDLKEEYFSSGNAISDEKENVDKNKEDETLTENKVKEIKNTNNKIAKSTTNVVKPKSDVVPKLKSESKVIENIDNEVPTNNDLLNADTLLIFEDPIEESSKLQSIFDIEESEDIIEFKNFGILSCYEKNQKKNEFINLYLSEKTDELCLDIFIPEEYNGSFGVIKGNGEYFRYEEDIRVGEWNTLDFKVKNISSFYFLPYEDTEILFYLRDVYEKN